jgi:NhaP-type Na+/H+ or K+/H+ antiporter
MPDWALFLYFGAGLPWLLLEHRAFSFETTGNPPKLAVALVLLQYMVHLARFWLVWPLYLLEDLCLWIQHRLYYEDDDE